MGSLLPLSLCPLLPLPNNKQTHLKKWGTEAVCSRSGEKTESREVLSLGHSGPPSVSPSDVKWSWGLGSAKQEGAPALGERLLLGVRKA